MGEKKRFKKVYIEVTNVCNLDCSFCIKTTRKKEFMSLDNFERIINQVKPYANHVYLHVMGEPLLHPCLDKILEIATNNEINVNITTNGTLIREKLDILLCAKPRKISFSLHSYGGNNADNNFNDYLQNILQSVDKLKERVICELRFWNGGGKLNNNRQMLECIESHFALEHNIVLDSFGRGVKIADNVYIGYEAEFQWPSLQNSNICVNKFCYGLKDQIAILVDGTVSACCLDSNGDIALGNIYKTPLADILHTSKAVNICNGFANRTAVEPLCQHCSYAQTKQI